MILPSRDIHESFRSKIIYLCVPFFVYTSDKSKTHTTTEHETSTCILSHQYSGTNIGFATSATAASTTIPAAKRKTTNINKNGIPGKQRNLAAPEAVLGNFQYAGNIPDDMAPVRGRTKSQKVGMNCSAMINADCLHTRARGVSSMP